MTQKRTKVALAAVAILGLVAGVAAVVIPRQYPEEGNATVTSDLLFDEEALEEDELPPIPLVNRTIEDIAIDDVQNVTYDKGATQDVEFYRNGAYNCGLSGKYTFMVGNPLNGDAEDEAPLWVYLHGGGMGYWDDEGNYIAVLNQNENTWNHEETFDDLVNTIKARIVRDGTIEDNTLTRRVREGYRILVVSMCDHDVYLGLGTPYPKNPMNANAEVNGLQATMAAIDYTTANYPTTHVFVHGTSAGSSGAYAVGMSYASEGIALNGVISDSILGARTLLISDELAGEPGFPKQQGYNSSMAGEKVGPWLDLSNQLTPVDRFGAGFNMTPNLQIGGSMDQFCGGEHPPLPEAIADGFDNNCAWVAQPLEQVAVRPENSLRVVILDGEGHVPTNDPGLANDIVDAFIEDSIAENPKFPFRG